MARLSVLADEDEADRAIYISCPSATKFLQFSQQHSVLAAVIHSGKTNFGGLRQIFLLLAQNKRFWTRYLSDLSIVSKHYS